MLYAGDLLSSEVLLSNKCSTNLAAVDEATQQAVRRIDERIQTLTMQYNRLPMRSPTRSQYAGELIGLREARAFVLGEPAP